MARALPPLSLLELRTSYVQIGRYAGAVAAAGAFIMTWTLCIERFGWLLGGALGWWPAMLAAGVAAAIGILFWGPLVVVLAILALRQIIGLGG